MRLHTSSWERFAFSSSFLDFFRASGPTTDKTVLNLFLKNDAFLINRLKGYQHRQIQKPRQEKYPHLSRLSAGPSPNTVIGSPRARKHALTSVSSVDTVICRALFLRSNSASTSACLSLTRSSSSRDSPANVHGVVKKQITTANRLLIKYRTNCDSNHHVRSEIYILYHL